MPTRSANSFHAVFSLHHPQTYSFSNSSPSVKLCLYLSDNFLSSVQAKLSVLLWTKRACKEDRLLLEDGKILRSIWITKAQAHSYGQKNLSSCKTSGGKTLSSPSGTKGLQQASTEGTFPFSSKGRGGVVPKQNLKKLSDFQGCRGLHKHSHTTHWKGQDSRTPRFCCDISLCQSRKLKTKDMQSHEHKKEALKRVLVAGMHKSGFRDSRGIRGNGAPAHMQCHGHTVLTHRRILLVLKHYIRHSNITMQLSSFT